MTFSDLSSLNVRMFVLIDTLEQHLKDVSDIINTLYKSNMNVSENKSNFFQK